MAYCALLRDEYPPFSWEPGEYPLLLDIPRAERQSRFRLFIRAFAIVPNYLVFSFVQIRLVFHDVHLLVRDSHHRAISARTVQVQRRRRALVPAAWPRTCTSCATSTRRTASTRMRAPATKSPRPSSASRSSWCLSRSSSCRSSACFARSKTMSPSAHRSPMRSEFRREAPTGEANNTRITLLDYDRRRASLPFGSRRIQRYGLSHRRVPRVRRADGLVPDALLAVLPSPARLPRQRLLSA